MSEYEEKYDRRLLARCRELEAQLAEAKDLLAMTVGYWVRDEDWAQRRDALLGEE